LRPAVVVQGAGELESDRGRVELAERSELVLEAPQLGVGRGGPAFTGSTTWRVRLVKGLYRFGSDARRVPGRLRVS
jgi:hypothetical protein